MKIILALRTLVLRKCYKNKCGQFALTLFAAKLFPFHDSFPFLVVYRALKAL